MKGFIRDFLLGMAFIITIIMTVCSLLVGVLAVAATISGQINPVEAIPAGLTCVALGGCAFAVGSRLSNSWWQGGNPWETSRSR